MLLAARDKVLRAVGKDALGKLVVYGSDQTHSSLLKANLSDSHCISV